MKKNKCKYSLSIALFLVIVFFFLGFYSEKIELEKIPYFVSSAFGTFMISMFILIKCYGK
jgi:small-conductance mechanosensitive channel